MIIVESTSFTLGAYTVQQRPRPDNPGFAVFIVMRSGKVIGKQFSRPCESDCQWLERERNEEARQSMPVFLRTVQHGIQEARLRGGLCNGDGSHRYVPTGRKRGRPRKDEPRPTLQEEIA